MRLNQVAAGLTELPVAVEYHTDWSIDDLADATHQSIFPIVGIDLRYIEGLFAFHAVVVAHVTREQIVVHDPCTSKALAPSACLLSRKLGRVRTGSA